jgi:hypothetical protein
MTLECGWCKKRVEWKERGLPPRWRALEYDANKYTEEFDRAVVCSDDCERRLAREFGAGGLR